MRHLATVRIACADLDRGATFWAAALGDEDRGHDGRWAEAVHPAGIPPAGIPPALHLQQVPEPTVVKNRVHLDLQADDRAVEVRRLEALGARALRTGAADSDTWTLMATPDGNECCVVA